MDTGGSARAAAAAEEDDHKTSAKKAAANSAAAASLSPHVVPLLPAASSDLASAAAASSSSSVVATKEPSAVVVPHGSSERGGSTSSNSSSTVGGSLYGGFGRLNEERERKYVAAKAFAFSVRQPSAQKKQPQSDSVYWSWDEIRSHNSARSCWIVVDDDVYDVTDFVRYHPAGEQCILRYAGTDASKHFHFHSDRAKKLFRPFCIGHLEGSRKCQIM